MEPEPLKALFAAGILAGAAFSAAVGFLQRGPVVGILCGLATGALLVAAIAPWWLALLGIMFGLS